MSQTLDAAPAAPTGAATGSAGPTGGVGARGARPRRLDALDGLRTIAVLLVVAYHLDVPGVRGGFLGVDIFFVLSGFLITSLLLKEIAHRGKADLGRFWMRRVLRLLPASLVVIVAVLVWAFWSASPLQRESVGLDALWSLLYVGNWRFIATSSYFADDGLASPLQHVWSLAVEEQFYLLWPLLLTALGTLAVARYQRPAGALADSADRSERTAARRRVICTLTCALALTLAGASALLLAVTYDPQAADRAYMGTDTKAFEPLVGAAAAALMLRPRVRVWVADHAQLLIVGGLVGVAVAVPLLGGDDAPVGGYYRGGAVVFALVCAALVAGTSLADRRHGVTLVLGSTPFAYIGRISYGVYLWHWPLVVWLVGDSPFEPLRAAGVAALTILVAALSYHLIEHPIRTRGVGLHPRRVFTRAGIAVAVAVALTTQLGGSPLNRVVPALATAARPGGADSLVLVGDSVMSRLAPQLSAVGQSRGLTVLNAARGGCGVLDAVIVSGRGVANEACATTVPKVQTDALAQARPGTVVWWSRYELADRLDASGQRLVAGTPAFWAAQETDLRARVDTLTATGARLVIVLIDRSGIGMDTRCTPSACDPLLRRLRDDSALRATWNDLVRATAARDRRVRVISMDDVYCRDGADPCDDRLPIGGPTTPGALLARPDGSHFAPEAMPAVAAALLDRVAAAS